MLRAAIAIPAGVLLGWLSHLAANPIAGAPLWFVVSPIVIILLTRHDRRWAVGWGTVIIHWAGYAATWGILHFAGPAGGGSRAFLMDGQFLAFLAGVHLAMHSAYMFVRQAAASPSEQRDICRQCGYWLRGLPKKHRCPECGARFDLSAEDTEMAGALSGKPVSPADAAPIDPAGRSGR